VFSVGYNGSPELFDLLSDYRGHIGSLYFPIARRYLTSARPSLSGADDPDYPLNVVERCRDLGIESHLLLNATCGGERAFSRSLLDPIIDHVAALRRRGLTAVVVTNPAHIPPLARAVDGLAIHTSVNCYIRGVESALYYRDLGVDCLTIDRDVNRDLQLLRRIRAASGLPTKIILNEGCLSQCIYRLAHTNYMAHFRPDEPAYLDATLPDAACARLLAQRPERVFRSPFIRPEDLRHYGGVADSFKLSTRVWHTREIDRLLQAYVTGRYESDLLDLIEGAGIHRLFQYIDNGLLTETGFFERLTACVDHCRGCGYCGQLLREASIVSPGYLNPEEAHAQEGRAERLLARRLGARPDDPSANLCLARRLLDKGQHARAREAVGRVLSADPRETRAHWIEGLAYEREGNLRAAAAAYGRGLAGAPKDAALRAALARCQPKSGTGTHPHRAVTDRPMEISACPRP
jgi:collagenase-like PrtC family protease